LVVSPLVELDVYVNPAGSVSTIELTVTGFTFGFSIMIV
jgi:hypothetical protein